MAVVTLTATRRGPYASAAHGLAGNKKVMAGTVEVGAADSANSVYAFFRIPSKARILGSSRAYWDDLASTGAPTLDFGLYGVRNNITDDPDALNDGLDAATTGAGVSLVKDIANYGKRAWEFVNGQTTDPGGELDLKAGLFDAAVNVGGTLTIELHYVLD